MDPVVSPIILTGKTWNIVHDDSLCLEEIKYNLGGALIPAVQWKTVGPHLLLWTPGLVFSVGFLAYQVCYIYFFFFSVIHTVEVVPEVGPEDAVGRGS